MSELIQIENLNAIEIFKVGGIDAILKTIESEVVDFIPDISTDKGRKEIASRAYKVAQSKTAIDAAGNVLKGADVSDINLARILKDGEQVYVHVASRAISSSRSTARSAPPQNTGPIAINRASAKELEALDGIGPVLASRIIAYRNANGPFVTLEALLEVSGIGLVKLSQFKEKIRL